MSVTKKTYLLGKHNQLIDLNGDTINFDITFVVTSENKEPFEMAVVDQNTLDNTPEIPFRKDSQGSISGNVVQDNNEYQNYFLALKSGNKCKVNVEITKKEIKYKEPPPPPPVVTPVPIQKQSMQLPVSIKQPPVVKNKSFFTMKYVVIGLVVIAGGILLYYLYMRKEEKSFTELNVKPDKLLASNVYDNNPIKIHTKNDLIPSRDISRTQRSVASSYNGSVSSSSNESVASSIHRSVDSSMNRSVASSNNSDSGSDNGVTYKPTSSSRYGGDIAKSSLFSRIQNIPM
jgi:hypothetical protein